MNDQSPLIKSTSGKNEYYRSENSDKPSGTPAGGKSFKKILNENENQGGGDETVDSKTGKEDAAEGDLIAYSATADSPKSAIAPNAKLAKSPFALFAHTEDKAVLAESAGANKTDQTQSPFSLNKTKKPVVNPQVKTGNEGTTGKVPAHLGEDSEAVDGEAVKLGPETDEIPIDVNKPKNPTVPHEYSEAALERPRDSNRNSKGDNFNSQFAREQPDLSYVNPMVTAVQQGPITTPEVQVERPLTSANLQSLVEQLVKELSIVKQGDKTETSIVLNHPPQFDGVKIVITQQENAANEFNLKFENLTQGAKQILDQQQNRADLMSNLERKGYNVHIFITTTYSENSLTASVDVQPESNRQDKGEEEQTRDNREERRNKDSR